MTIRLITDAGDLDTLVAIWNEYRTAEISAYIRDSGWTRAGIAKWLRDPDHHLAIDPVTQTVGVFVVHRPSTGEVVFIGTRTTAPVAARRAVDAMLAWGLRRAVLAGITYVFGSYTFPAGVDVTQLRAIKYFGGLGSVTLDSELTPKGDTKIKYETHDPAAVIAFVEAR